MTENEVYSENSRPLLPTCGTSPYCRFHRLTGGWQSTLVDRVVTKFRQKGKTVGVLAIDPTSPFTGGAILGDRIRMQKHFMDEGVFIRSRLRGALSADSPDPQRMPLSCWTRWEKT